MVVKRKAPVAKRTARKDNMTPEEREREFDRMMDEMGGLEYIQETFALHKERRERLRVMYGELKEKYPDKWVAIAGREEPIVADSREELRAKLDELGIDRDTVAKEFMRTKPRRMIL